MEAFAVSVAQRIVTCGSHTPSLKAWRGLSLLMLAAVHGGALYEFVCAKPVLAIVPAGVGHVVIVPDCVAPAAVGPGQDVCGPQKTDESDA